MFPNVPLSETSVGLFALLNGLDAISGLTDHVASYPPDVTRLPSNPSAPAAGWPPAVGSTAAGPDAEPSVGGDAVPEQPASRATRLANPSASRNRSMSSPPGCVRAGAIKAGIDDTGIRETTEN